MTKELIYQLKNFEIFVEKIEIFVNEIKQKYHVKDLPLLDLRSIDGNIFALPNKLEDFFELWNEVQEVYKSYQSDNQAVTEMFFDLYFNDTEINTAFYDDKTFWVYFNEEGFYYEKN